MDDDVRLRGLERLGRVALDLDAEPLAQSGDLAEVAAHLGRVDVDRADDLEPGATGNLLDDRRTDRTEPEMQHTNVGHESQIISGLGTGTRTGDSGLGFGTREFGSLEPRA